MAQLTKEEMDVLMRMLQEAVTEIDKEEPKQEPQSEISEAKRKDMDEAMTIVPKIKLGMIENEQLDLKSDIPENTVAYLCDLADKLSDTHSGLTVLECCLLRRMKDLLDLNDEDTYQNILVVYKSMVDTIDLYVDHEKTGEDKEVHQKVISCLIENILKELAEEDGL